MHPDVSKLGSCLLMHHGQETTEAIENLEPWTEELRKWNQSGLESIKTATYPPYTSIELICTGRYHTYVRWHNLRELHNTFNKNPKGSQHRSSSQCTI
jgi:hypothetical protein